MGHYCTKCNKTLDEKQFYLSHDVEKYPPDGRINICKKCLTMHIDNWDPETFKWILEELDIPYIKTQWDEVLKKYASDPKKLTGITILGRYLSKMKLAQWKNYRWADSEKLEEEQRLKDEKAMKAQGMTPEEIQERLKSLNDVPERPKIEAVGTPEYEDPAEEVDEFSDKLTEEDKIYLRLKWGKQYRAEEWVRMEDLYNQMMKSYDIQTAGHKDTLILICKTSLKANQLLDMGDIEGFQKISKVYDQLMKSGKFTAAQNKEEQGEFVDSVGELVAVCEKDGFVPRYYTDEPKDKVDKIILDMQEYTHDLVTEELGLGNLIENGLKQLEREREMRAQAEKDNIDDLFNYDKDKVVMSDEDIHSAFVAEEDEENEPS